MQPLWSVQRVQEAGRSGLEVQLASPLLTKRGVLIRREFLHLLDKTLCELPLYRVGAGRLARDGDPQPHLLGYRLVVTPFHQSSTCPRCMRRVFDVFKPIFA